MVFLCFQRVEKVVLGTNELNNISVTMTGAIAAVNVFSQKNPHTLL